VPKDVAGDFSTDSGMLCLWDVAAFAGVVDYETWEDQLCENRDIRRHIKAGHFVPINTNRGIDGAFAVRLRVGRATKPAALTARERTYLLAEAPQPYLLVSSGGVCLSALEGVAGTPGPEALSLKLTAGRYAVTVCFIGWDEEPGMRDKKGQPKPGALPDFVLLMNPAGSAETRFRTKVHALDDPE
jgi:hypothetical protein